MGVMCWVVLGFVCVAGVGCGHVGKRAVVVLVDKMVVSRGGDPPPSPPHLLIYDCITDRYTEPLYLMYLYVHCWYY